MAPLAEGDVVGGRYTVGRRLDADEATEVWSASDAVLARAVLLEMATETAATTFAATAAAAARIIHPGVVATYDSGSVGGVPYIVTERPVGPSLAEIIQRQGAIPASRVVVIGRQLARALEAAHGRGVTHGAVTPKVVLVAEDDRVKIARLGAAAARAELADPERSADDAKADDVRGCARTLVAALVGGHPTGPSARAVRAGVPPALDDILVAAQMDPPAFDARQLAVAFDALDIDDDAIPFVERERTPPLGTPVRPPPRRPAGSRTGAIAGVVVGLLLAVSVGVAAFVLNSAGGSGKVTTGPTTTVAGAGRAGNLAVVGAQSFNPLGTEAEHATTLANLVDGDPSTAWTTFTYASRAFGGLKAGDGVFVTLDRSHALHQVTVTSATRGWTFSLYVARQPATTLAGWGAPVGPPVTVQSDVTPVSLSGSTGGAVLIWITQLGASPPYQVSIGEIAVR